MNFKQQQKKRLICLHNLNNKLKVHVACLVFGCLVLVQNNLWDYHSQIKYFVFAENP